MTARRRKSSAAGETEVKVGVLGGEIRSFVLEGEEPTIEDALEAAGFEGRSAKIDGDTVEADEILEGGETILVTEKVEGGV